MSIVVKPTKIIFPNFTIGINSGNQNSTALLFGLRVFTLTLFLSEGLADVVWVPSKQNDDLPSSP
jgi:hypothetical protein